MKGILSRVRETALTHAYEKIIPKSSRMSRQQFTVYSSLSTNKVSGTPAFFSKKEATESRMRGKGSRAKGEIKVFLLLCGTDDRAQVMPVSLVSIKNSFFVFDYSDSRTDHPLLTTPYKLGTTMCGSCFMVSRMWHPLINITIQHVPRAACWSKSSMKCEWGKWATQEANFGLRTIDLWLLLGSISLNIAIQNENPTWLLVDRQSAFKVLPSLFSKPDSQSRYQFDDVTDSTPLASLSQMENSDINLPPALSGPTGSARVVLREKNAVQKMAEKEKAEKDTGRADNKALKEKRAQKRGEVDEISEGGCLVDRVEDWLMSRRQKVVGKELSAEELSVKIYRQGIIDRELSAKSGRRTSRWRSSCWRSHLVAAK